MNQLATDPIDPMQDLPRPDIVWMPVQQQALKEIEQSFERMPIVALHGPSGAGKSVLARAYAAQHGALVLDRDDYVAATAELPLDQWQVAVRRMLLEALDRTDFLVLDDTDVLMGACGLADMAPQWYPRNLANEQLFARVLAENKKLLLVGRRAKWFLGNMSVVTESRFAAVELAPEGLGPVDYRVICEQTLASGNVKEIDFPVFYEAAPNLRVHQLRLVSQLCGADPAPTTTKLLDLLQRFALEDHVDIRDVEEISFATLPGSERVARALETHVVTPFERPDLAISMGIKAQRGVLLYGPPGTGKTSIGRALAHRLQGRFFLIDGSIPSEPPHNFMLTVRALAKLAMLNSPSVLFIDDADLIFELAHVGGGLERFLLSLLDGLESDSNSKVCVMMTVMDPKKLPEALLRSGRVELWLETSPPDESVRAQILKRWLSDVLPGAREVDFAALAAITSGFTPADLRRVANDAKLLYAADLAEGARSSDAGQYLRQAVGQIVEVRRQMALAFDAEILENAA